MSTCASGEEQVKETFRKGKHLVFKDQQPAKQVSLQFSFSLMTTRKGWQASFLNLLKHYTSVWEYWLCQALCAVSFVSERGCLHFEESQWKLYSICGRIIRWSIVLLLQVENELCSRCIIFYRRSNRSISNVQILTWAVPHAQDVCLLMCEHTYIPLLGGGEYSSGTMAFSRGSYEASKVRMKSLFWKLEEYSSTQISVRGTSEYYSFVFFFFFMEINQKCFSSHIMNS